MQQHPLPIWENPMVTGQNREPGHALATLHRKKETAMEAGSSPFRYSLNGDWSFLWHRGAKRPKDTHQAEFDDSSWQTIKVPGVWQLQGYGTPYYYALSYPQAIGTKKNKMPQISRPLQEIGIYRKRFTLPRQFADRQVFLHFGAAKAGLNVWVNGEYVGYSQGSNTPHEFDITSYLNKGKNQITAAVYRYTDGTYLEDQDMWFMSGLSREVYLYAEPTTCIRDFYIQADFDALYTKTSIQLEVFLKRYGQVKNVTVRASIPALNLDLGQQETCCELERILTFNAEIPCPKLWSHEHPNLYKVLLELTVEDETTYKSFDFGFKKVEIQGNQLFLNGKKLLIRGVNRHEWDPDTGWSLSRERYHQDIKLMKRLNINALRTSHYPNDPLLYEMCNKYGILVMDEAEVETHGVRKHLPGNDPRWVWPCVDRMERMVLRDRNHPCVFFWSLGNEAGGGQAFAHMRYAAEKLDKTRPFHYEGEHTKASSDVISRMYPDEKTLQDMGNKKRISKKMRRISDLAADNKTFPPALYETMPVLLCEYSHSMENSLGNFMDTMAAFHKYPHFCGGFIWDYIDQSIRRKTPNGEEWLYGDDLPEIYEPRYGLKKKSLTGSNGCFCANGILSADRTPHPSAFQVKKGYQALHISPVSTAEGRYLIQNGQMFSDLSLFRLVWRLELEGTLITEEALPKSLYANLPAGEEKEIQLPKSGLPPEKEGLATLTFRFLLAQETLWANEGYEVAFSQFILAPAKVTLPKPVDDVPAPSFSGDKNQLVVTGKDFSCQFTQGALSSYKKGDTELLVSPLRPQYYRALTDNDRGVANFVPSVRWLNPNYYWKKTQNSSKAVQVQATTVPQGVQVQVKWQHPLCYNTHTTYIIYNDGKIEVSHKTSSKFFNMLRVGITMALPKGFSQVEWLGRGPHENYPDRKECAPLSRYACSVEELAHSYMRPQENGTRGDTHNLVLSHNKLKFHLHNLSHTGFHFSAWHYTQTALDEATHIHTLQQEDLTTLNIDGALCGVGGDIPGFALLHKPYTLPPRQEYSVHFLLEPQIE